MSSRDAARLSCHERALIGALRAVPSGFKGKSRFARWLCGPILDRRDVMIVTRHGDMLSMPNLREPIAFHCLIDGIYEVDLIGLVERLLPEGGTFLDIGANVGVFTMRASRLVGATGKVVAIEASPGIVPYLRESIRASRASNVIVVAKAVTDRGPTTAKFWAAPPDHFGMGALAPQFHNQPMEIEADTIDHVLSSLDITQVHLLKIDIEGFECAAFQGALELLSGGSKPPILLEFVDWAEARAGFTPGAAQQLLRSLEFSLFAVGNGGRLQRLTAPIEQGSANLLAVPYGYDLSGVGGPG